MTIDQFREIRQKAGGLIMMLPKNLLELSLEEKENIFLLEQAMLVEQISIPVYFSKYDEEIDRIISEINTSPTKGAPKQSAIAEIFKKISANSYQIVVSGTHSPRKDSKIPIIQGELIPFKQSSSDGQTKLPVIIISAQIKPFGVSSSPPPANFDATVMLTLADVFSKLYNQVSSSAKYRIIFVLDESGSLLNYQGVKKWLENVEENVHNIEFAVCLEGLAESIGDINLHVSKPPKEGTSVYRFYEILEKKTKQYSQKSVDVVHKKINLADNFFKFPHERFSMKRISAFTISSLKSHTDPLKSSMFIDHSSTSVLSSDSVLESAITENIQTNIKILAETLASFIFNFSDDEEIFTGSMTITEKTFKPYVAPKLLSKSNNLKLAFEKLLKNVKVSYDLSTERDSDFMFYDGEEAKLDIWNVKPAVFDLFLTSLIGCYLFAIYFIVLHFPKIYTVISKFSYAPTVTSNGVHAKKMN